MLYNVKILQGFKLHCLDGEIGKVEEFYFDDKHWAIRYLVANTGNWLTGRQVLISPYALKVVDKEEHTISVKLTKKKIKESPSLESDKPVSRQFEMSYYGYFGWPEYWGGDYIWGNYPYIFHDPEEWKKNAREKKAWDHNLRSTREVSGYHIQATDGEIGHVADFIIDDETWVIHYLIIDTHNWLPGKKVLISPKWINRFSWEESKAFINLPRETIKKAPEYIDGELLSRDYEAELYSHHKRKGYWDE
jgi:uncharacterized protein YrrD